jgi:hypothetical protein
MNAKTYCPLGEIYCGRHKIFTDGRGERCVIETDNGYTSTYWIISDFDTCPFINHQQKIERYDMCEDQPAQIRCHSENCIWNKDMMVCKNISPAIEMFSYGSSELYGCHSFKQK